MESDGREWPSWLASVGAELRSRVGDEFRAEAEAEEHAVAALRERRRGLTDVAVEILHRGDAIAVSIGETTVTGRLTHVASDLATLSTASGATLHLRLESPVVLARNKASPSGRGRSRDAMGCDSFLAVLRALSVRGARVRLETGSMVSSVTGRITAVAVDHLVFCSRDTERFVPLETVWGVWE